MKLHIINLEERKDRNYQMKQQVRKFNFDHIFIEAIRGRRFLWTRNVSL